MIHGSRSSEGSKHWHWAVVTRYQLDHWHLTYRHWYTYDRPSLNTSRLTFTPALFSWLEASITPPQYHYDQRPLKPKLSWCKTGGPSDQHNGRETSSFDPEHEVQTWSLKLYYNS